MKIHHLLCVTLALGTAAVAAQETTPTGSHRTDWFHHAKWGVFMHYMADTVLKGGKSEKWPALGPFTMPTGRRQFSV